MSGLLLFARLAPERTLIFLRGYCDPTVSAPFFDSYNCIFWKLLTTSQTRCLVSSKWSSLRLFELKMSPPGPRGNPGRRREQKSPPPADMLVFRSRERSRPEGSPSRRRRAWADTIVSARRSTATTANGDEKGAMPRRPRLSWHQLGCTPEGSHKANALPLQRMSQTVWVCRSFKPKSFFNTGGVMTEVRRDMAMMMP